MVLVLAVVALFWLLLSRYFTLADVQRLGRSAGASAEESPLLVVALLALAQGAGMAFSLPTKALLTLLAGALLGPAPGSTASLVGVTTGTTGLFFAARYLLRDQVKQRLGRRAEQIEERIGRRPVRALIGLRLFITLPYGPITLASALTSMRYRHFLLGTLIGDIPVTVAYCIAGKQLFLISSVSEAVSPWTVATLATVGLFVFVTAIIGKSRRSGTLSNKE